MPNNFQKRVPDEFGLVLPRENGIHWIKQGGGFSCTQHSLEGVYIPIGKIKYHIGYPEWSPDGPEFEQKLRDVNLQELSTEQRDKIPGRILKSGHFETSDQYMNWIEESEHYGWITLWDDLRRFTYGIFENLDSDPRLRWDSSDDLWSVIDESLGFDYEEIGYSEYQELDFESYPNPQAAIRPIRITNGHDNGRFQTNWSELEGEIAFLLCPNAD